MKIIKKILILLLIALIVIQFLRPEKNLSETIPATDFIAMTSPSPKIETTLRSACYDCHSNNTKYPWYSEVAPISFLIAEHVKDGKKHLNFSEWGNYSVKKKAHKLEELIEEVEEGHMPESAYTWMHAEANLSKEQVAELNSWAKDLRFIYQLGEK
ncbi:heme-binding domain-containing protein [Ascidiimonas sp. W6]|uniref:heme-binding domain-containing protein n=1 Tax=Ascidiimonas meishanensis TaxID=3128903 RepID=UPI0030EF899C